MTSILSKLNCQKSQPRDFSRTLQVIGCGLGRTGTNSFSEALEKLLPGPVYHSGTAIISGDEDTIQTWIAMMQFSASRDPAFVKRELGRLLTGFVAVTDTPIALFTPELCELYPDAMVICTTRDVNSWYRSWKDIEAKMSLWVMSILLRPIPTWRSLAGFLKALDMKLRSNYPSLDPAVDKELYELHMEFVKRVVPRERLHFFDVKEGWGPLCAILGLEVPQEPFPRGNDKKAMEELSRRVLKTAVVQWARILGYGVALGVVGLYLLS